MKYIVELKYTNPSHEHVSLRRRVETVTRVVEAKNENEALNRAANQQRALGFTIKEAKVTSNPENSKLIAESKKEESKTELEMDGEMEDDEEDDEDEEEEEDDEEEGMKEKVQKTDESRIAGVLGAMYDVQKRREEKQQARRMQELLAKKAKKEAEKPKANEDLADYIGEKPDWVKQNRAKAEELANEKTADLAEQINEMKQGKEYTKKELVDKMKAGNWETSYDIKPGKHVELTHRSGKKVSVYVKEEVVAEAKGEPPPEFMPSDTKLPRIKVPAKPKPGVRKRGPVGSFNKKGFWNPGVRYEEVEQVEEAKVSTVGASKASDAELANYLKKKLKTAQNNQAKGTAGYPLLKKGEKLKPMKMEEEVELDEAKADPKLALKAMNLRHGVDADKRDAGYKMSPAVRAAQAKSDALSKVVKQPQAGTLAAKKMREEVEDVNEGVMKSLKKAQAKYKSAHRAAFGKDPTIKSGIVTAVAKLAGAKMGTARKIGAAVAGKPVSKQQQAAAVSRVGKKGIAAIRTEAVDEKMTKGKKAVEKMTSKAAEMRKKKIEGTVNKVNMKPEIDITNTGGK